MGSKSLSPRRLPRSAARWLTSAVAAASPVLSAGAPLLLGLPFLVPTAARAQYQPPSEKLHFVAKSASSWNDGATQILQLDGPVTIDLDQATLSAKQAVVWMTPDGKDPAKKQLQVVLIGDGRVRQGDAIRSGEKMLVNATVAGKISLTADSRDDRDLRESTLFQQAEAIRRPPISTQPSTGASTQSATLPATGQSATTRAIGSSQISSTTQSTQPSTLPTTAPDTRPSLAQIPGATTQPINAPILFDARDIDTVQADDGTASVVLTGGVKIYAKRPNGDQLEFQGQRAVIFTSNTELKEVQQAGGRLGGVTGLYLEGEVRAALLPGDQTKTGEQRLEGKRVYYDFMTEKLVLTDAVMRTIDTKTGMPFIVHANIIRRISKGEFETTDAQLSTSMFATPTYSINASKIYIQQVPSDDVEQSHNYFQADNTTFRLFGVPFFWLPRVAGDLSNSQTPLRTIGFERSSIFGPSFLSGWGLFETLGMKPPRDLDAAYRLDYYGDRGPGAGLDAKYQGGSITETGGQPWSFTGDFRSYFVYDHGQDEIGRGLPLLPADEDRLRGRILWQHQHILPDDWTAQIRAGYVSDQNFLEQYFPNQFDRELPHDVSVYLKHQRDNEAFTLLIQFQPNDIVTTSDLYQEQFEVEHFPEIGYHRIAEPVFGNQATLYSDNSVSGLHFQRTRYSLVEEGFVPGLSPGIPSVGTTGVTDDTIWRGDFRQELDFPINAGPFKFVPYVMGRYTYYSDSPEKGTVHRLFAGAGFRATTAFWKVDDLAQSDLFDIHRIRHVVEPEINFFTGATTADRSQTYLFDESIDPVNDVTSVQLALRQRWQTYRGGPGRWRSVDFVSLNIEADLFNNQPAESQRQPIDFRGLYFPSLPELSVPRNAINGDITWRIADTTALLADAQWNADKRRLATASIGILAQRDERESIYLGTRYIDDLHSNITTVALSYQLNAKYQLSAAQSFDFGLGENVVSSLSVIRKFDALFVVFRAFHNETTNESGVGFSIIPRGLKASVESETLNTAFRERRQ